MARAFGVDRYEQCSRPTQAARGGDRRRHARRHAERARRRLARRGQAQDDRHFDFPRAKEGGLTGAFFSIYVDASYAKRGAARRAHELIDLTLRAVESNPAAATLAASAADIRAAKQAGKLAVLMGTEGGTNLSRCGASRRRRSGRRTSSTS